MTRFSSSGSAIAVAKPAFVFVSQGEKLPEEKEQRPCTQVSGIVVLSDPLLTYPPGDHVTSQTIQLIR